MAELVIDIDKLNDHDSAQLFFIWHRTCLVLLNPSWAADGVLAQFELSLRQLLEIVELGPHGLVFLLVLRQVKDEVEVARAMLEHLVTGSELEDATIVLEKVV